MSRKKSKEKPEPEAADSSIDSFEKYKDSVSSLTAIVETGLTQYQVEWQRISTMQQSAGVLIAGLTIVVSALLGFLSLDESSTLLTERSYLNAIIYPTIYITLCFVALSMAFFFHVIWPRSVKSLPPPLELFRQLEIKELWKDLATIIERTDTSIADIHDHVQRKQYSYLKSLHFFAASVVLTGITVLFLLLKVSALETNSLVYIITLSVMSSLFALYTFKKSKDGR